MQIQQVWSRVHLLANLKLWYNRFSLSRIAKAYFALALLHCIVQIAMQIRVLGIERSESFHLHHIMNVGEVANEFAILDSSNAILICHAIPGHTSDPHPCDKFPGDVSGLTVTALNGTSDTCSQVLSWPAQIVHQAIRESIAMTVFQSWLIGISVVAIIRESIPHVVAGLITQLLSTVWSLFHIVFTAHNHQIYNTLVTDLACNQVDPMPNYWESKMNNEIPIFSLNAVSLVVCSMLSWKLCKQFGVQSFTRVGGCKRIHHLYLLVLILSVFLQLTMFFLLTSLILWIEQLFDGTIATLANKQTMYLAVFIATAVLIIPWWYMGWVAVRRERRLMMVLFLLTSILLIVSQMSMFISPIYRLTFSTWYFFGATTVVAYILLNLSFFMALVCRYFFGRGLAHFLQVQRALGECDFTPVYIERETTLVADPESGKVGAGGNDKAGALLPWDVQGRGVVKKLSLPGLDQRNDDGKEGLSSMQRSISSTGFQGCSSPSSQLSFCESSSQDSHDSTISLTATTIPNEKGGSASVKSTSSTPESRLSPSDGLSHKSSVRSNPALPSEPKCKHDSKRPPENYNNTAHAEHRNPIRRGRGFSVPLPTASGTIKFSLVGLPSSVKQK